MSSNSEDKMSSISEDESSGPSLKELVLQNLDNHGILGKLKAQLRSSVFLILEEEFKEKNIPLTDEKSQKLLSSEVGKVAVAIIQDFLQCLDLDFTLAVFCPESKSLKVDKSTNQETFNQLSKSLNSSKDDNYPFLFKLIEEMQKRCSNGSISNKSFCEASEQPSSPAAPSIPCHSNNQNETKEPDGEIASTLQREALLISNHIDLEGASLIPSHESEENSGSKEVSLASTVPSSNKDTLSGVDYEDEENDEEKSFSEEKPHDDSHKDTDSATIEEEESVENLLNMSSGTETSNTTKDISAPTTLNGIIDLQESL